MFVDYYGLDRSKIEFVNLTPPSIQAAVINGDMIAGSVWQPFRYNVQQELGENVVQFNEKAIYKAYSIVAVRAEVAEHYPDEIKAFLGALIKAEQYIQDNQEEAIALLSAEMDVPVAILSAVWDEYDLVVRLDEVLNQVFQDEGAWIQRSQAGFEGQSIPSYEGVLNPQFLLEIDSTRVIGAAPIEEESEPTEATTP